MPAIDFIPILQLLLILLAVAGLTRIFFSVIRQEIDITVKSALPAQFRQSLPIQDLPQGRSYYNFFRYQIWRFYRFA